jgi:hypothetical protein
VAGGSAPHFWFSSSEFRRVYSVLAAVFFVQSSERDYHLDNFRVFLSFHGELSQGTVVSEYTWDLRSCKTSTNCGALAFFFSFTGFSGKINCISGSYVLFKFEGERQSCSLTLLRESRGEFNAIKLALPLDFTILEINTSKFRAVPKILSSSVGSFLKCPFIELPAVLQ